MSKSFLIAPSILSADFARLGEEVDKVLAANTAIAAWCNEVGIEIIDAWPNKHSH